MSDRGDGHYAGADLHHPHVNDPYRTDTAGRDSRFGDANRIRQWMEGPDPVLRVAKVRHPRRLLARRR